jgi:signal transduction histidine kinase
MGVTYYRPTQAITLEELPRLLPWTSARFQRGVQGADPGSSRDEGAAGAEQAADVASGTSLALEAARLYGEERRRLERDLHDGAQQRLVSLSVQLSRLALRLAPASEEAALLAAAQSELRASLAELRDLAHGLHPSVLTDYGLEAALQAVCTRAPLPVRLIFDVARTLPAPVEVGAYYLVCEALTNVAKYARASCASVRVTAAGGTLAISVADDGVGGASMAAGSGLRGLGERLAVLGGTLAVDSPVGGGTTLRARIPLCVGL